MMTWLPSGSLVLVLSATLFSIPDCVAAEAPAPYVKIIFPADGIKLDAKVLDRVDYDVVPGPGGDHLHLYVDGKEAGILRKLSGSHPLEPMNPAAHTLCIKVVNKAHVPIGVEQCNKVTVE